MTDILDGFDERADRLEDARGQRLRAAMLSTGPVDPVAAARANALSDKTGAPFGVVADNLADYEERDRLDRVAAVGGRSPVVGDFLADPRRMALAGADAEKLERLAQTMPQMRAGPEPNYLQEFWGGLLSGWERGKAYQSHTVPDIGGDQVGQGGVAEGLGYASPEEMRIAGHASYLAQQERQAQAAERHTALTDAQRDNLRRANEAGWLEAAGLVLRSPRAVGITIAESLGMAAPGLLATVATGGMGRVATAATAGTSSGTLEYGASLAESMQDAGIDLTDAYEVAQFMRDPKKMEKARDKATKRGLAIGTFDALTAGYAGALLRNARRGPLSIGSRVAGEMGVQAAGGMAGEATAQLLTEDRLKWGDIFMEGIAEIPMGATEIHANIRTAARAGQVRWMNERIGQVVGSVDANERLRAATELAGEIGLAERSPADMAAFAAQAAREEQRVYLPAEQAQVLFQSEALLELVGSETVLAEQLASGELSVPLSQWMAVVPRLSNSSEILRHARTTADGMSPAELESFNPDALFAELAGDADTAAAAARATTAQQEASQRIEQDVMGQLIATGRYTDAAAEAQAKLFAAGITTMAQRAGQDPAALYDRYMGGIRSGRADGQTDPRATRPFMESWRLDALLESIRAPEGGPTSRQAFGPSLSSWLVSEGGLQEAAGELRARDDGKLRPGLVNRSGMPIDRARELAVEAGFLPEGAELADFLDALDADLRGDAVYSEALGNQERQQFDLDRQALLDAIENTPALRDLPAGEFRALTNQQIADMLTPAETFGQQGPAGDLIESEGFREWFGNRTIDQLEADYAAMPETDGGRRIDTDLVRELAPAYVADRSLSQALHPYASRLTKELFTRALARPVAEGRSPFVHFLAGGGGSGKSTATVGAVSAGNADIIFDGTLSNLANARRDIEASLASGRLVRVDFVYRSPEKSAEGAIGRAIRVGRPVPVWALAEAHSGAPKAVKALAKEYDGDSRVLIAATWNDGEFGQHRPMSVEEIPDVDREEAERTFRAAVERAAEEGRADDRLREAFNAGGSGAQDLGSVQGNRPEEPAGNAVTETPPTGGVSDYGPRTLFQRAADGVRSLFQRKPARPENRGQIAIFPDRTMAISLYENADRSTFLHETGHFFLEVYSDLAAAPDASQQVRDDFAGLLQWMGVESADKIGRDQHEQFARAFEHYLAEGKAPSPELQSVFSQFMAWLRGIYRSLQNLDVNLTEDVRGIMDRMLAADEQIELAQARQGMEPLARSADEARALGMTEQQWQDYIAKVEAASEDAKAEVLSKLVQSQERALKRWWKDERAAMVSEVAAEYEAMPVFRAERVLRGAKTLADGSPMPEALAGLKLDREALASAYGEQYLQRLRGLYAREGGVDLERAAMLLGFSSGDAMVKALANRGDMRGRIDAEADARMRERHGDPFTDGTLPELAMAAVHGNRRVQVLERELRVLADLAGQPAPSQRVLAAAAREIVQGKTSRELRPNDHLVAERRAARQALQAAVKGDYAGALQAKRQQAFNAALFRASRDAQERAESTARYLRKAASEKTRERVGKQAGKSYVEALDAIFAGHEVGEVSGRQVARRAALRDWVRRVQDEGSSTAVSEALLARVEAENVTNIADLPMAELEAMREAVENLLHLARLKNKLLTAKGQRDWEDAKADMLSRLAEQPQRHGRDGISEDDRGMLQRVGDLYAAGANWVLQPETIIEWLDGGTMGPFHDLLWDQAQAAERRREALNRKIGGALQAALDGLPADQRKALDRRVRIDSLEADLSGHSILAALMNMGNAGNRDKLLRGGRVVGDETVPFTEVQLAEMFSTLTKPQAETVQKVWDAIDLLWPEIMALEESMNGIAPERVDAQAFTVMTKDGPVALRGGYYPAMYDPKGAKAGQLSEDEQAVRVLSGQTPIRASTSKGHTEKRTEFVAPLLLDYQSVLTRHLDGVIGDIAYRQFLRQVFKVLGDADIRRMIDNRVGPGAASGLRKSFERGATGNFSLAGPLLGPFQKLADATMTNVSAAALGARIPLAMANTVAVPLQAAARVKPSFILRGLRDYYLSGGANIIANMRQNAETVQRLSPLMLRRAEARSVEMASIIANLRGKRGLRAKMIETVMSVQQWSVPLAENAVWMGAYQQAQAGGASMAEAVAAADKAIRQTQTSTSAMELSSAQAGHLRMFMMFAGPLVIMNNRLQESGLRGLRGDVRSWPQALGVWMAVATGAVWSFELMMGRGPDSDDDDADAGDWAAWAAKKLALFPFAAFPILRDAAGAMDNGRIRGNPVAEAAVQLYDGTIGLATDLFGDEEVTGDDALKRGTRAAGAVTGIPSNQLLRTGEYLMEVSTGEHTPENPAAEAYYFLQGPPKEK